jgi:hypothetical protein
MTTVALFPDAPALLIEGERKFVAVPWDEADALRAALLKHSCPTTLCLDPETRQARLELWPGVKPEAVLAVLEARRPASPPASTAPATPKVREKETIPAVADPADQICI